MEKHTKGPFHVEFGETAKIRAPDGGAVAICTNLKGMSARGIMGKRGNAEVAANARLFAASHDMLEGLRLAVNTLNTIEKTIQAQTINEVIKTLNSIINEATGVNSATELLEKLSG